MFVARMIPPQFDGLLRHVGGRWKSVCARVILVLLFAIWPLAEASPPDAMWVGGMYDGADLDDVVGAVMAATAVIARSAIFLLDPFVILAGAVLPADRALLPTPSLPARPVRAPPPLTRVAAA